MSAKLVRLFVHGWTRIFTDKINMELTTKSQSGTKKHKVVAENRKFENPKT